MIILGIESSCDETAVGIVARDEKGAGEILSNQIASQIDTHAPYGGVVPELAARAHVNNIDHLVRAALAEARLDFSDLDAVAATAGPGLIGSVMVGLVSAKAIALVHDLPFLAINHLEAHALSVKLTEAIDYPFLLLLISGGHSALISVRGLGDYHSWGSTRDDAVGEAFDKTARLLGLGWPGGAILEKTAAAGDPDIFPLPRPFFGAPHADFSFAGLKTAVRRIVESDGFSRDSNNIAHIAASFQEAVAACLTDRTAQAIKKHQALCGGGHNGGGHNGGDTPFFLVAAGGVAANQTIRARLRALAQNHGGDFLAPPPHLCTDNGVMIAWAGAEHFAAGRRDSLTAAPRMRWPLGVE